MHVLLDLLFLSKSLSIYNTVKLCSKFLRSSFLSLGIGGESVSLIMALEKQMSIYSVQRDVFPLCTASGAKIGIRTQKK